MRVRLVMVSKFRRSVTVCRPYGIKVRVFVMLEGTMEQVSCVIEICRQRHI